MSTGIAQLMKAKSKPAAAAAAAAAPPPPPPAATASSGEPASDDPDGWVGKPKAAKVKSWLDYGRSLPWTMHAKPPSRFPVETVLYASKKSYVRTDLKSLEPPRQNEVCAVLYSDRNAPGHTFFAYAFRLRAPNGSDQYWPLNQTHEKKSIAAFDFCNGVGQLDTPEKLKDRVLAYRNRLPLVGPLADRADLFGNFGFISDANAVHLWPEVFQSPEDFRSGTELLFGERYAYIPKPLINTFHELAERQGHNGLVSEEDEEDEEQPQQQEEEEPAGEEEQEEVPAVDDDERDLPESEVRDDVGDDEAPGLDEDNQASARPLRKAAKVALAVLTHDETPDGEVENEEELLAADREAAVAWTARESAAEIDAGDDDDNASEAPEQGEYFASDNSVPAKAVRPMAEMLTPGSNPLEITALIRSTNLLNQMAQMEPSDTLIFSASKKPPILKPPVKTPPSPQPAPAPPAAPKPKGPTTKQAKAPPAKAAPPPPTVAESPPPKRTKVAPAPPPPKHAKAAPAAVAPVPKAPPAAPKPKKPAAATTPVVYRNQSIAYAIATEAATNPEIVDEDMQVYITAFKNDLQKPISLAQLHTLLAGIRLRNITLPLLFEFWAAELKQSLRPGVALGDLTLDGGNTDNLLLRLNPNAIADFASLVVNRPAGAPIGAWPERFAAELPLWEAVKIAVLYQDFLPPQTAKCFTSSKQIQLVPADPDAYLPSLEAIADQIYSCYAAFQSCIAVAPAAPAAAAPAKRKFAVFQKPQ